MDKYGFNFATTYTQLPANFFTKCSPDEAVSPALITFNKELASSIGLKLSTLCEQKLAYLFSGNRALEGVTHFAQAYAGHQFGRFSLLGDGRVHNWGEHLTPAGDRLDIQFKGSGRTAYSRQGDGKGTLGAMLREYIISEAMHFLRIPTTRSLCVVTTGEQIQREELLPGAILTRVASSHIRVGTFEFAVRQANINSLQQLLDYTIMRHYPELLDSRNKALDLIKSVQERQIDLIIHWMRVGFIHGVMNTDNMSIAGETIDYGPCAFMDTFHNDTVFSSIDYAGRYAYGHQPTVAQWNLARFAETLLPLVDKDLNKSAQLAADVINQFSDIYEMKWLNMMRAKLGLIDEHSEDKQLILDLLTWMQNNRADYTHTFVTLSQGKKPQEDCYKKPCFEKWFAQWGKRLEQNKLSQQAAFELMQKTNPVVIPRNHKVEEALSAAHKRDFSYFESLLKAVRAPYEYANIPNPYQLPPKSSDQVYQTFCGT